MPLVGCSPDDWVFVLGRHLTQLTMMQLYYKIVSVDIHEMNTIHEGDIVLVDRSFCDVNFLITNKKLHVYCHGLGLLDTI